MGKLRTTACCCNTHRNFSQRQTHRRVCLGMGSSYPIQLPRQAAATPGQKLKPATKHRSLENLSRTLGFVMHERMIDRIEAMMGPQVPHTALPKIQTVVHMSHGPNLHKYAILLNAPLRFIHIRGRDHGECYVVLV